jgi:hypothetical protein
MFKRILIAAVLAAPLFAYAEDKGMAPEKALTPQQERMSVCNKEAAAKDLKGDPRKAFMKSCLSEKKMSQQEKMKVCNKDAGEKALKGDDRKKFMSECLKGESKG